MLKPVPATDVCLRLFATYPRLPTDNPPAPALTVVHVRVLAAVSQCTGSNIARLSLPRALDFRLLTRVATFNPDSPSNGVFLQLRNRSARPGAGRHQMPCRISGPRRQCRHGVAKRPASPGLQHAALQPCRAE